MRAPWWPAPCGAPMRLGDGALGSNGRASRACVARRSFIGQSPSSPGMRWRPQPNAWERRAVDHDQISREEQFER